MNGRQWPTSSLCPSCNSTLVPVGYGYLSLELIEAEQRGEVVLGGCHAEFWSPTTACPRCLPAPF